MTKCFYYGPVRSNPKRKKGLIRLLLATQIQKSNLKTVRASIQIASEGESRSDFV